MPGGNETGRDVPSITLPTLPVTNVNDTGWSYSNGKLIAPYGTDPNYAKQFTGWNAQIQPAEQNYSYYIYSPNDTGWGFWANNAGTPFSGLQNPRANFGGAPSASPSPSPSSSPFGLGVGGGAGTPFALRGNGGAGGGTAVSESPTRRYARMKFDSMFGNGWTDKFIQQNGVDPITFHLKDFPQYAGDPERQAQAAERAAENDARFQPGAIAEWQKVHGNAPIPEEQWKRWYYQAQNGGANYGQGDGVNPFGVY